MVKLIAGLSALVLFGCVLAAFEEKGQDAIKNSTPDRVEALNNLE